MIKTVSWALALALLPLTASAAGGVTWAKGSFKDALAGASKAKSPLMVDVYATWCGPCQKLDSEVFPTAAVGKEAASFVAVKIDGETEEGEALVAKYNVVGYPTVLFLTPSGEEIDRIFGFLAADEFAQTMRDYRSGKSTLADLQQQLKAKPKDLGLKFEVGRRLAIKGVAEEARRILDEVRADDADNKQGLASKSMYVLGKYLYLRGRKDHRAALGLLKQLQAKYPSSEQAASANYPIARAHHGLGDDAKALGSLQALIDAAPKETSGYNTFAWFSFKENVDRARGVRVAMKGLDIDPKAAGLWDTLAELHFAMGNRAEAIEAISKAVSLEPDDPYFKGQLKRFSEGKPGKA